MYDIFTAPNGVRVINEHIPGVRSASLGIWIASGTRHEPPELGGISHFIEHMLFKGTASRDARTIAELSDRLGGEINAFTTKECTCFYARVLDEELLTAADMLADMFFCSLFDEAAAELERGVIGEEIRMYDDVPEELAMENLCRGSFSGTSLGMPITGTHDTIRNISGSAMRTYRESHYTGNAVVISLAGSFGDSDIEHICELFSDCKAERAPISEPAVYHTSLKNVKKQTEQANIAIGFPACSYRDDARFTQTVLSAILGGNMSSRLFQRIREELGLCYSVYSFISSACDTGILGIYLGTNPDTQERALSETAAEISRLCRDGVTSDELERAVSQTKAGMLISLESTSARQNRLGKGLLLNGAPEDLAEIIRRYECITTDEITCLARKLLKPELMSVSTVIPRRSNANTAEILKNGLSYC